MSRTQRLSKDQTPPRTRRWTREDWRNEKRERPITPDAWQSLRDSLNGTKDTQKRDK